ncbi:DUF305 domain-containing protein [Amycolatopsis antarctica]|uniref:DUF305 domain-containing protein n=1 Tax=Amycolatopsis antarctica TaxID=1854586 RepID=A0A263CX04_9PSEU|nr:DUF305 domain-containing protein [Amycolatopsis antarctica]OZM70673.1 DUF305 domain-containing protein [Amycolatopsis antarctica]
MRTMKMIGFAVSAVALSAALAACGGEESQHHPETPAPSSAAPAAPAPAQGQSNQADITFAQQMIPHHQQAVEMAKLVAGRTSNQQVIDLAAQIQQAQDPEIQTMTAWLQQWGAPVLAPMPGMDHSGHGSMPGMMSAEDMGKLEQSKDTAFDTMWLTMMVDHHQGAIDMATTEQQQGASAEAKQLAGQIITAQQAEIATMNGLLNKK